MAVACPLAILIDEFAIRGLSRDLPLVDLVAVYLPNLQINLGDG